MAFCILIFKASKHLRAFCAELKHFWVSTFTWGTGPSQQGTPLWLRWPQLGETGTPHKSWKLKFDKSEQKPCSDAWLVTACLPPKSCVVVEFPDVAPDDVPQDHNMLQLRHYWLSNNVGEHLKQPDLSQRFKHQLLILENGKHEDCHL